MPTPFELKLIDGPPLPQRRWSIGDRLRIGRAEDSELILAEPSVSRQHAIIEADITGWTVRDCRNRLGTRLNELTLAPGATAALHAGDVIAIGPWRFRIDVGKSPDPLGSEERGDAPRIDVVGRLGNLAEQRLELLLRCAGEVAAASNEHDLADTVAEYALLGSGYPRAAVLWRVEDDFALRSLRPVAAADETSFRFSRSLIASAETGEIARIEIANDPAPGRDHAVRAIRRALCAPLMLDGRAVAFFMSTRTVRRDAAIPTRRRSAMRWRASPHLRLRTCAASTANVRARNSAPTSIAHAKCSVACCRTIASRSATFAARCTCIRVARSPATSPTCSR
jgi:hypothetical protein